MEVVVGTQGVQDILEARMPRATITPTRSLLWISNRSLKFAHALTYVPTPDITRFKLRHQLAF